MSSNKAAGFLRLATLCLLVCASAPSSFAHQPFDNSVHAILHPDGLEVMVTLGGEASIQFLNSASPDKPIPLGGMGAKMLPVEIAAHLCDLKSGGKPLVASGLQVNGDGLEYTFTATYPSPAGDLAFHGLYFDSSDQMQPGTFVLTDDRGNQLGSGLISRGSPVVGLALPPTTPSTTVADVDADQSSRPAVVVAAAQPGTTTSSEPSRPGFGRFATVAVVVLAITVTVLWVSQRRPSPL